MKTVNSVVGSFAFSSDWTWSWPGLWGTIKRVFFKYINGNRQCKNNISPLQDEGGCLTNGDTDMDKTEMFNVFFACLQHGWWSKGLSVPWAGGPWLQEWSIPSQPGNRVESPAPAGFLKLYGIHPTILKELVVLISKLLLMIFEQS